MASSVEKRMALALPVLRTERFCGVMSTPSDKSFSRILRCARTTSKLTMMGINLNGQFLFLLNFPAFVHDPSNKDYDSSRQKRPKINAQAEIKREIFHAPHRLIRRRPTLKQKMYSGSKQPIYQTQYA